ncbi:MAG: MBL fold metallo-hydrolase [Chlamydiales bacterium]|nr:MBL fold metallo-hydrolase [Chlamydiales bacterium]
MEIKVFPVGPFATNCILVMHQGEAVIIDPGYGAFEKIQAFAKEKRLDIKAIWLTHSHWDHIVDVATCEHFFSVPVFIHPQDAENMKYPGHDKIPCIMKIEGVSDLSYIKDKDQLLLGDVIFTVIHTPGHSPGSVCFYAKQEHLLISGDTLFAGSIGSLSLPTSNPEEMWKSLEKIAILPADTKVVPGHGEMTKIGKESWLKAAKEIFGEYL